MISTCLSLKKHGGFVQSTTMVVLFLVFIGVRIQETTSKVTSNITYQIQAEQRNKE